MSATAISQNIITSRSSIKAYQDCARRRYWGYEALSSGKVRGWERRKLALPLVTGIHTHAGIVGDGLPGEGMLNGEAPQLAIARAINAYRADVAARGIEVEVEGSEANVINEQAALIEALLWGWWRVRLPFWLETYEVVATEREITAVLSDDVLIATRADALVRRRLDGKLFLVNFKTVGDAGETWYRQWELDMQLMTETLAAEQEFGEQVAGVIIEGLIKGRRHSEKKGEVKSVRETSKLIYGYKFDGNPPLEPPAYDWNYTQKKGWHRFSVWDELEFGSGTQATPIEYWVNWLPIEVVEQQFAIVPPIWRDVDAIERKTRQIVGMERRIRADVIQIEANPDSIDYYFPSNEHSCLWPSRCQFFDICHTSGVAADPEGSKLYMPRKANHPVEEGGF